MKKLYALLLALASAGIVNAQTYCTPTCSNPSGGCTYGRVNMVAIPGASGTLMDTLGCTGSGYEDYHTSTSMTCTFAPGGTYTGTFTSSYPSPKYSQVWVDFDADGTFSSSESVGGANSWGYSTNPTITIPSGVSSGSYRMRFVSVYGSSVYYPSINPCMGTTSYMFGDARDYTVSVASSSSGCTGTPTAGTASATTSYSCGFTTVNLSDAGASSGTGISYQWEESSDGGTTWTSISGGTGITLSIPQATVNMQYRLKVTCSSTGSSSSTVASVNVDRINGHITYSGTAPDTLSLKVWLIYHNTTAGTLTAVDSTLTCLDSLLAYYEFNGMGAGQYLVKAQSLDVTSSTVGTSGYVPTYGASSATWGGATTVNHTGTYDSLHINMIYGTVPSGPGFIGGLISSGAGKGTSGDVPAVNMLVYLQNTATNVLTQTYTDATGAYSFNGIATGSYVVYPEKLNYATTPSGTITLTASSNHVTGINFKEHTTSKTITPITTSLAGVTAAQKYFTTSPNPTSGLLNINWNKQTKGDAQISVLDVTGREVYHSSFVMEMGGDLQVDLSTLNNGVYFVKVVSASVNYGAKISMQH